MSLNSVVTRLTGVAKRNCHASNSAKVVRGRVTPELISTQRAHVEVTRRGVAQKGAYPKIYLAVDARLQMMITQGTTAECTLLGVLTGFSGATGLPPDLPLDWDTLRAPSRGEPWQSNG